MSTNLTNISIFRDNFDFLSDRKYKTKIKAFYSDCSDLLIGVSQVIYCTKKPSFPGRISSANMTKSAVSSGFGHIY